MKFFCISFLTFLLTLPLSAQQQASPTHRDEIVVTASAEPDSVEETPAAVSVVTREDIEKRGARDIADVLREVPGVAVSRTGSPGKFTSLFMRGGSSKQALVLWNGVEMNNPYFSGYNFGQLSTAGVQRVEIVRGPFSALYGSDAVSGVVQVLTEPAKSEMVVDAQFGENGLVNGAVSGAVVNDRWNLNGSVERREDDGFFANDDSQSDAVAAGATFKPWIGFSLGFLARRNSYTLGVPFSPNATFDAYVPSLNRREKGSETQLALPVHYERGALVYDLRLSESRRDETFRDPDGFGDSDTDSKIRAARATVRLKTRFGAFTAGGEREHAEVDHLSAFSQIDARDRSSNSLFFEDSLRFQTGSSSVEVVAGVRYDDYDTFGGETTPKLAMAWLRDGHKVRAAYGQAFRAPAIGELYSPFFGNADLAAERSRNAELGYERFSQNGSASITLFRSQYRDLIAFGAATFENIDAANAQGIELAATRRIGPWDVLLSYTWLDSEDKATAKRLPRRPEHSGSIAFGYRRGAYDALIVIAHKGERDDVRDLLPFGLTVNDANTVVDFTLHYDMGSFTPYVKIENVADETYEEVFGYRSAPRRAIVGIRYAVR